MLHEQAGQTEEDANALAETLLRKRLERERRDGAEALSATNTALRTATPNAG